MTRRIQPLYLTHNESERQATITSAILPGAEFHAKRFTFAGPNCQKIVCSLSNAIYLKLYCSL